MPEGAMVTYKDLALQIAGYCGLVVKGDADSEPGYVWVRWNGNSLASKEFAENLIKI